MLGKNCTETKDVIYCSKRCPHKHTHDHVLRRQGALTSTQMNTTTTTLIS